MFCTFENTHLQTRESLFATRSTKRQSWSLKKLRYPKLLFWQSEEQIRTLLLFTNNMTNELEILECKLTIAFVTNYKSSSSYFQEAFLAVNLANIILSIYSSIL